MKAHTASELQYTADILGPDTSVLISGVRAGVQDLMGRRLEQAQLIASETSHMLLFHTGDITGYLTDSGYIDCDGTRYIVDYTLDPRKPRPGMWTEVYAHAERTNS